MRAADLNLGDLLTFDPNGGIIRFAGQRTVLLDTAALGILRCELVKTIGSTAARGILTRLGYAHGWHTAETFKTSFPWDDPEEWREAGGRLHTLQGLVVVEAPDRPAPGGPFAEAIWHDSYEAEQHLLQLGRSDEPVCWTLCGFASGYLSCCHGREVVCIEDRCRGRGDAVCHLVGRFREEWGDEIAPHLPFYEKGRLDSALARVTEELQRVEKRLHAQRRELGSPVRGAPGIVARSEAMGRVLDLARRVAPVDSTVLFTGESGVGKERLARFVHDESARMGRSFVALNCGAVPESLLESELFGHARGSFTGATQV